MEPGRGRSKRVRALRRALRRAEMVGPVSVPVAAGLGSGFLASFAVDGLLFQHVGVPGRQLIDAAVFALVAAPVWIGVQRRDVQHATEVLTWLNGWESDRWSREIGRRLAALPRADPRILDALPDTLGLRPLRVELLGVVGEDDDAWARLERLPTDTAWQRFERAALTEWLLWLGDGPEQTADMEAAVAEVEDDERRLVARAMLAAARARRAAVSGGDAIGPLAAVRPDLGDRPGRYALSYRTGIIVSVLTISLVASVALLIAAAIIR